MSAAPPIRPRLPAGVWAALAALWAALTIAYVGHPEGRFTRGGEVHGDGVYYYAYLRSLVHDGDLDFENDYALLGNPHRRPVGEQGLRENRFAIGAGLLWLPSYAAAQAVTAIVGDGPDDGTKTRTQRITLYASVMYAALAALIMTLLARRYVADWIACAAAVATVMATPLWWYAVYQPSWPHAASACVVGLFVLAWERGRAGRSGRGWLGLGALLGLVALVRAQDVVFAVLVVPALVRGLWQGSQRGWALRSAGLFAVGAGLAFAPQMIAWWSIYGSPLTIPQGPDFMRWGASKPAFTLFSSRNGLLSWSPIVSVALIGLGSLALRRGPGRALAGTLLLAFALEAYILGSTRDWWGGWAFGGRRYVGCSVMFGLGLAVAVERGYGFAVRHHRGVLAGAGVAVLGLFSLCNLSLVDDYLFAKVERGASQPMRATSERAALRGVGAVYETIGHPGAIPANWWFAWQAGVGPQRYDAVSGYELTERTGGGEAQTLVWLDDPRWAGHGFGPRSEHAGRRASVVAGREARFVVPLRAARPLQARVLLAATGPGATLEIAVAGAVVFASEVSAGWRAYDFEVPAQALSAGFNWFDARQTLPEGTAIAWGSLQLWRADQRRPSAAGAGDARP